MPRPVGTRKTTTKCKHCGYEGPSDTFPLNRYTLKGTPVYKTACLRCLLLKQREQYAVKKKELFNREVKPRPLSWSFQ